MDNDESRPVESLDNEATSQLQYKAAVKAAKDIIAKLSRKDVNRLLILLISPSEEELERAKNLYSKEAKGLYLLITQAASIKYGLLYKQLLIEQMKKEQKDGSK